MKLLLVLASVLAVGLSEKLLGGKKDEDISNPDKFLNMVLETNIAKKLGVEDNDVAVVKVQSQIRAGGLHDADPSTYPTYLKMALGELGLALDQNVEVVGVQTQVVGGMKYYITLKMPGVPGTCEIDIYERSWENYREVTQDTCSTKKRQLSMPGGWSNVQDIPKALADNADLQKAVDMIVQRVNDMDNGLYRVVESSIVSIRQQVVSGMNYNVTMEVGTSTCLKSAWKAGLTAQDCPLDANMGTPMIISAVIYSQPWTNTMNISFFNMKQKADTVPSVNIVDNNGKDHLLGGDGHDVVAHGSGSDDKQDLKKVLLGGDNHDYQIHGVPSDKVKGKDGKIPIDYGNMMDGYGGPDMMGGYQGGNMMDGYRAGDMMDGYRRGDMMDGYRRGYMMGGYGGDYMMGGYKRRRLMGGYRGYGPMMGGYRGYGPMMGGYRGRDMMGGYRRGSMMDDYIGDDKKEDKWGGHMMDPKLMDEYMSRNGMMGDNFRNTKEDNWGGHMMDPKLMDEYMSRNGMDTKSMYEYMSRNGMGPKSMFEYMSRNGMDTKSMYEYMSKNGMMDPKLMDEYMSRDGMMGDYRDDVKPDDKKLLGGDAHDYRPHKPAAAVDESISGTADGIDKALIGGDGHDYLPHGDTETSSDKCNQEMFLAFQKKYSKTYKAGKETSKRYRIFCDNMKTVAKLQQTEKGTARYGPTKFADLTEQEFKQYVGKPWKEVKNFNTMMKKADIPKGSVPESFDWRDHGAVTPVKNQGSCGSCWAFSTTGNIEGQWAIKQKKLISLSEQELVDCDKLDDGCNGGLPSNAYKEIERLGGLETESEYKYKGEDEKCEFIKKDVKVYINDSVSISKDETEMAAWLAANGPISIGINAFAMQFYMGGISHPWKIFCNPKNLDHGVLIVGYGVQKGEPYWIVKNSWGEDWGEKGYYLVYRGAGVCGLNTMCTSAVVN